MAESVAPGAGRSTSRRRLEVSVRLALLVRRCRLQQRKAGRANSSWRTSRCPPAREPRPRKPRPRKPLPTRPRRSSCRAWSKRNLAAGLADYKLLQQIGEGGCGVVYMAEQEEPIRRRVALKVIKLGMDTRQVIARFEAERQALALMDHPNIAKVLDAGATETGRPYFVMELVRGIKITDYCDQNNLSTEQRLDLFIQVCHAIQHAHQKGIIHRDIKPSNILVTVHDGVPVPKVIDFGIAKATGGQVLTDKTLFTAFEQFIGTPAYMSPEQAEMSGLDIDTRSDIYSLGVLLYELLTGKTPFDAKELVEAGLEGMRRMIREQEPSRPSTKISTLGAEEQTTIAKRRQVEPPKLIHQVRGDLDWIVMKCLEKDRTRRYEGASGLAQEIERHLNHEPVSAGAPSAMYRLRKFARRHRAAMAMAAVIFGLLLTGITAVLWQWRQTEAARRNAVQAEQAEARESYAAKLALATAKVESGQLSRAREILASCPPHLRHWEWYWLNNSGEAEPKVLEGHLTEVTALAFTPDGQRLVTAHLGAPLVWDVDSGQRLTNSSQESATRHRSFPWLALSENDKSIITVPKLSEWDTRQRQVRIWESASGRQLRSLWLTNWVETMSGRGNRIFLRNTTNQPPGYTVLEATTGRVVASLMATGEFAFRFSNFVNAEETDSCVNPRLPAVSADGRRLLTQTLNKVPNPRPGEAARSKESGAILILPLMDRPRPQDNQGLRFQWTVWDVDQAQPVARLPESEAPLVFAAFSPDGKILFTWDHSFSDDPDQSHGRGAFWETSTGRQVSTFSLPGRTHYFRSRAVFSGDGRRLLIARNTSPEWPVEVWDVRSGRLVASLLKYDGELGALALSPDGSLALTADRIVRVWDATKGTELTSFAGHADRVVCAAFSPDGRFVATGSRDKTARLWPIQPGRLQVTLDTNATYVEFAAKGRYVLARQPRPGKDGSGSIMTIREPATGREISRLEFTNRWEEILLLPDELHLVGFNSGNLVADSVGEARVYDLLTGQVRHTYHAEQLGLAPGSGRLIGFDRLKLPGSEKTFRFSTKTWDAASGKLVATNDLVGLSLSLLRDGRHALASRAEGELPSVGSSPSANRRPALRAAQVGRGFPPFLPHSETTALRAEGQTRQTLQNGLAR